MVGPWRVLPSAPGAYETPPEAALQEAPYVMPAPTTVAAAGCPSTDDHDYWCATEVDVALPTRVEFAGLTFPATVFVDGAEIAQCTSMFLPVTVDLPPGRHDVTVRFGSLTQWLKTRRPRGRWRSGMVAEPGLRWARTTLLGRAPVYGDLPAPVGFWRPVTTHRVGSPSGLIVAPDAASGSVVVTGSARDRERPVDLTVLGPGGETLHEATIDCGDGPFRHQVAIDKPQLWWPRHHGRQHLYQLRIQPRDESPTLRPFGFRTVSTESDDGGEFALRVNGVPVFCRGAVWVPPDPITLTAGEDEIRRRLTTLADTGATMVRIAGGLVYEQPEFWRLCAELGLMVWQDAMLCTFDPPDEIGALAADELRHTLSTISGNPALSVVSGGSETLQRPEMLGLPLGSFPIAAIDTGLPAVVDEHARVPYVRSSPAPDGTTDLAIRPDTGVSHWFGVGGYLRSLDDVTRAGVRFAAESLAFAIPPGQPAIDRHFGSSAVAGHHPAWKRGVPRDRGASWDFEDVRDFYVREIFGVEPLTVRRTDPDRYLQLGRLAVGAAMRSCYAYWRRSDTACRGALVLAAADLVPGAGWGLLDVDGNPKAPLALLRQAWRPDAVVLTDEGLAGVRIDVYNDAPTARDADLHLTAVDSLGNAVVEATTPLRVPEHGSVTLRDTDVTGAFRDLSHAFGFGTPIADAVAVTVRFADGGEVQDALVITPRSLQVRTGLDGVASPDVDGTWVLTVTTDVVLRYLWVETPGWDVSDNAFHLLPGCPRAVRLTPQDGQTEPSGWISSIDATTASPITSTSPATT